MLILVIIKFKLLNNFIIKLKLRAQWKRTTTPGHKQCQSKNSVMVHIPKQQYEKCTVITIYHDRMYELSLAMSSYGCDQVSLFPVLDGNLFSQKASWIQKLKKMEKIIKIWVSTNFIKDTLLEVQIITKLIQTSKD